MSIPAISSTKGATSMSPLHTYPCHAAIMFKIKDETATKKHPETTRFIPISRLIARFTAYTHILYDEAEITHPPKITKKKFLKKRNGNTSHSLTAYWFSDASGWL
jgi:hypothetical protein